MPIKISKIKVICIVKQKQEAQQTLEHGYDGKGGHGVVVGCNVCPRGDVACQVGWDESIKLIADSA